MKAKIAGLGQISSKLLLGVRQPLRFLQQISGQHI